MPESHAPETLPYVNLDAEPFKFDYDALSNSYALSLVTQTFSAFEVYRSQNYDRRWTVHDSLYFGTVPQKNWPGTSVPRSSLGMPLVFDQVESALPSVMDAIFGGEEWFQVEPELNTPQAEARQTQSALLYDFDHGRSALGLSCEADIELAARQMLLYGIGAISIDYDPKKQAAVPSWVDIRNLYFDPACPTPSVADNRSVIRKLELTVEELKSYRGAPGMMVPPDAELSFLGRNRPGTVADMTVRNQEALRGVMYLPGSSDYVPNPADQKIEVLIYTSPSRIIWIANRIKVLYNEPNPYGFINIAACPCFPIPGRFYAQGIADVQEGNQRYIEALLNARLDEVALTLHPPRAVKRGLLLTPAQTRWGVGQTVGVDNPNEDIKPFTPSNVTANVMGEIQLLEVASEKRTGINGIGMGVPRGGNVNRTATGVQSQQTASANRLRTIVKGLEDYLLGPMLYMMHAMKAYHADPEAYYPAGTGQNGTPEMIQGRVFLKPAKFKMLPASRLTTRAKLMEVTPMILQNLTTGPLVNALQAAGQTVDFNEVTQLIIDSTGISKRYNLVRPMTPQEQQAKQAEQQQMQAQQQMQVQAQQQAEERKSQTAIQVAQINNGPKPGEQEKLQGEMALKQMEMQMKQMEAQQKAEAAALKLQVDTAVAKLKIFTEQQSAALKAQAAQQKIDADVQKNYNEAYMQREQHGMQMQQQAEQHEFSKVQNFANLRSSTAQKEQELNFRKKEGEQKLELARKSQAASLSNSKNPRKKAMTRPKPKAPTA